MIPYKEDDIVIALIKMHKELREYIIKEYGVDEKILKIEPEAVFRLKQKGLF